MLIEYIVPIALIIGNTAASMARRAAPEEYMFYIEIDIDKQKFNFCIVDSELNNIRTGIIIRLEMESTKIYHLNLYNCLIENDYNTVLLNSIETRMMKRSTVRWNKTDKRNSEAMA